MKLPFPVNFGLIAVVKDTNGVERVAHFVGYKKPPTDVDRRDMLRELAEDPEFGLVGVNVDLVDAPLEQVELYAERGLKKAMDLKAKIWAARLEVLLIKGVVETYLADKVPQMMSDSLRTARTELEILLGEQEKGE